MFKKILVVVILVVFIIPLAVLCAEPVKIGAIFPITGKASVLNLLVLKGAKLAVDEINAQGGVLNRKIKLVEIDNMSTAIGSKLAAIKAVKANVIAVIGPNLSSHAIVVAKVLQKAKIPMITPIATNPEVTRMGDFIFRACYTDDFQGRVMAEYALHDLKAKKAAVLINTDNKYSIFLSRTFINHFKGSHGKIDCVLNYLPGVTDFNILINQLKDCPADIIFLPGYDDDSAPIIKHARLEGINTVFLGGDGWGGGIYAFADKELNGNYFCSHWHRDKTDEKSLAFVKKFESVYSKILNSGPPLAYDSVNLLKDAIVRATSFDRSKIRDALAATNGFSGVTGTISFDASRNPVKSAVIKMLKDGRVLFIKTVAP